MVLSCLTRIIVCFLLVFTARFVGDTKLVLSLQTILGSCVQTVRRLGAGPARGQRAPVEKQCRTNAHEGGGAGPCRMGETHQGRWQLSALHPWVHYCSSPPSTFHPHLCTVYPGAQVSRGVCLGARASKGSLTGRAPSSELGSARSLWRQRCLHFSC